MPTGARITAAANDISNAALDVAVPPPPVLGAPLGVATPGETDAVADSLGVGEGDPVGHWLVPGEGDAVGQWLGPGEGDSVKDSLGSADGDAEGSSAAATPAGTTPNTVTASSTVANRRSHARPCRRTGSLARCDDPSSIIFRTTTPFEITKSVH
jgi:hypothetical protein